MPISEDDLINQAKDLRFQIRKLRRASYEVAFGSEAQSKIIEEIKELETRRSLLLERLEDEWGK